VLLSLGIGLGLGSGSGGHGLGLGLAYITGAHMVSETAHTRAGRPAATNLVSPLLSSAAVSSDIKRDKTFETDSKTLVSRLKSLAVSVRTAYGFANCPHHTSTSLVGTAASSRRG